MQIVAAAIKERHDMETDMGKVRAASEAFYAALNARDPSAMAKVWAHTPYVAYISPVGSEIALGWDAVNKAWEEVLRKVTSKIDNYLRRAGVPQIVGNLAWEVGTETGPVTFADGKSVNFTAFATNIYQNIDGRWLMVSHQAGNQTETSSSQSPSWTLSQYPRRL